MANPSPSLERVTTINRDGSRRFIHPADVHGPFTRWRAVVGWLLVGVYVALPWIPIQGNPAVFFDVAARQFHLFGLTFVAQDLWLAFFVISGVGFALFSVAALLGRIWCGWGCPQTVFLDITRRIERWIEGNSLARQRLDQMPWTLEKTLRRGLKHAVLAGFALVLAHVFLSYFLSLPRLYAMMHEAPSEHWGAFSFVFLTAAALWFDFAWFREQFCIVLCPYGRLQSVLVDPDTLAIGYDAQRGEPRGTKSKQNTGDCVDCNRCVQVCPTGIDIRQGLQMECIGCAACVDACNTVMSKLDRPQGLIRYDSMNGLVGKPTRWIRPRILLYTALLCLGAAALGAGVSTLHLANMSIVRMSGAPYFLEQGNVRNQFLLRLINKRNEPLSFDVEILGGPANLHVNGAQPPVTVPTLSEQIRPLVIALPRTDFTQEFPLQVRVRSADGKTTLQKELTFIGPASAGHSALP